MAREGARGGLNLRRDNVSGVSQGLGSSLCESYPF